MEDFKGKLVKIYNDAVSREIYEGIAKIVRVIDKEEFDRDIYYRAKVRFKNEDGTVLRWFTKKEIINKRRHRDELSRQTGQGGD
jgi:hypothetical protein